MKKKTRPQIEWAVVETSSGYIFQCERMATELHVTLMCVGEGEMSGVVTFADVLDQTLETISTVRNDGILVWLYHAIEAVTEKSQLTQTEMDLLTQMVVEKVEAEFSI